MDRVKGAGAALRRAIDRHFTAIIWLILVAIYLTRPADERVSTMMLTAFGLVTKAAMDSIQRTHQTWVARMKSEGRKTEDDGPE
ncbi:MAG: hypothetical protein ACREDR_00070 [Blastocatellia bacterium]